MNFLAEGVGRAWDGKNLLINRNCRERVNQRKSQDDIKSDIAWPGRCIHVNLSVLDEYCLSVFARRSGLATVCYQPIETRDHYTQM